MNITGINASVQRLVEGIEAAIERIEGKENQTDKDEARVTALEEFMEAVESALDELNSAWETA